MKFGFRTTVKSLFNVKSWMGWGAIAQNGAWIRDMYGQLLRPHTISPVKETFEEACERYGYTAEFLKHQEGQFEKAVNLFLGVFCTGLLYMAWLLYTNRLLAGIVMVPLNFMLFSFYFRESFWLMQIRQRRLGMSFKDWLRITVLRYGKAH